MQEEVERKKIFLLLAAENTVWFIIIFFILFLCSLLQYWMFICIHNIVNLQPLTNCYNLLEHSSENLIYQEALTPLGSFAYEVHYLDGETLIVV